MYRPFLVAPAIEGRKGGMVAFTSAALHRRHSSTPCIAPQRLESDVWLAVSRNVWRAFAAQTADLG